jgi:hypothetical protein
MQRMEVMERDREEARILRQDGVSITAAGLAMLALLAGLLAFFVTFAPAS